MYTLLLIIFFLCFTFITIVNLQRGLFFLFLLLPTYLIDINIGPLPTNMLEIMLGIIVLVWAFQKRAQLVTRCKQIYSNNFYFIIGAFLFILAATISIFNGIDPVEALGEWKSFYIEPIILTIVLATTLKTKAQLKNILSAILISGFVTSLLAIYQHFTGAWVPYSFWENNNAFRVTGWYGFPNAVGHFLAPTVIIGVYLIYDYFKNSTKGIANKIKEVFLDCIPHLNKESTTFLRLKSKWITILAILSAPAALLGIIFAKSTGAIVGVVGGLAILILFTKFRWWAIGVGLACLMIVFYLPSDSMLKQELLLKNRTGQLRINMWRQTYNFLSDNPISGAGISAYKEKIVPYRKNPNIETFHHPHNLWLTIWVNLGLLGFTAFNWVLIWFYKQSFFETKYNNIKLNQELALFSTSLFTTFLVMGLVDSPYIKNDLALLFWFPIALMLVKNSLKREKQA
ncbi:MAG: hypothetical protein BRC22_01155 [Parcubacteria group bacterium QH_9_35_7]|nr:MAG: hypothetical protein BRC22_01155 [Parcubacteria group bacterium QH_9_35_7]